MIVADTGPIIIFTRTGQLDILRQVVGELVIPTWVSAMLETSAWRKVSSPPPST